MARLADPPTETIDSLKRRFIRQNRELARHNSTQSVKIRSLEDEISRLLAANISLREENIQLRNEFDEARDQYLCNNVSAIKTQFEAKLKELLELTGSLGDSRRKAKRRKSQMPSPRRPPAQDRTFSEILSDQEGRMPTIVEGKYFPRRTMDAQDIQSLLCETGSDSPLIASPPMPSPARRSRSREQPQTNEIIEETRASDNDAGLLFANLETRRRRRESQVHVDGIAAPEDHSSRNDREHFTKSSDPIRSTIRAGAKRKLDVRNSSKSGDARLQTNAVSGENEGPESRCEQLSPRKALAPKSVNTDPVVSPMRSIPGKKTTFKSDLKDKEPDKRTSTTRQPRSNKQPEITIPEPFDSVVTSTIEIGHETNVKLEPKTPGELSIFSPPSTIPTDERLEARDTPPPGDIKLDIGSRGDSSGSMRGSRRVRAAISYAEPSLNTKMRRPSKTLVDAVVKRPQGESKVIHLDEERPLSTDATTGCGLDAPTSLRTVTIKKEDYDVKEWQPVSSATAQRTHRAEPHSPLGERAETNGPSPSSRAETSTGELGSPSRAAARSRRRSAMQASLDISTMAQLQVEDKTVELEQESTSSVSKSPTLDSGLDPFSSVPRSSSSKSKSTLPPSRPSGRSTSKATGARRQTLGSSQSMSDISSSSSSRSTTSRDLKSDSGSSTTKVSSFSSRPKSRNDEIVLDRDGDDIGKSKDESRPGGTAASRRRSMML